MSGSTTPHLFWVGDSIALHYQPYLISALEGVARVEFRSGYREAVKDLDHPRGANCGDSSMVLPFLRSLLARPDFDARWIVFNCGLHDIKTDPATGRRQVDVAEYGQNLRQIVALIREYCREPVWVMTTPVDDARHHEFCPEISRFERDVLVYNEEARRVMTEARVPMIDLHRFTKTLGGELYMDHVHYTEEIRRVQAAWLAGQVEGLLKAVATPPSASPVAEVAGGKGSIVLLGDSTVADQRPRPLIHGWGEELGAWLPGFAIHNLAVSGASTRSYLTLPRYAEAKEIKADWWLIQFGHNDMKSEDPARYSDPVTDYRTHLRMMIAAARANGATPVLVTSPHRLKFDDVAMPTEELLPYVEATRIVGQEDGVAVIDLHAASGAMLRGLGPDKSKWITATELGDFAHFTQWGSRLMALFVARELETLRAEAS